MRISSLQNYIWHLVSSGALLLSSAADAKPAAKDKNLALTSLSAEADKDNSTVTVLLNRKPTWEKPKVESHGTFLQVILPQTQIPSPGEFFDGNGPFIRKLTALQITPDTAAIRLFVSQDAGTIVPALKADVLDNRLLITVEHKLVEAVISKDDPAVSTANSGVPTADQMVAKVEVTKDIPTPSSLFQKQPGKAGKNPLTFLQVPALQERLFKIAFFLGAMLLGLLVVYMLRPLIKRRRRGQGSDELQTITMRTLATHVLAPKQRLALVQVGKEQVLLGLTPESINFIKSIGTTNVSPTVLPEMAQPAPRKSLQEQRPPPRRLPESEKPTTTSDHAPAKIKGAVAAPRSTSTFETRIDDSGIVKTTAKPKAGDGNDRTISDVTRLIREKLRNLPPV